jgi:uncharacterized cupin superfamily protein
MQRINIGEPDFAYDGDDPEGFRSGMLRMGKLVGATETGISVYEIPPGQAICPYHYEWGEEEWLIVVAGRPTLRHPGGEDELAPWDVVFFSRGPDGAHAVRNGTDEPVRVLMFSTVKHPSASVYPDSDKIGIWTGDENDSMLVRRSSRVDYWDGEVESSS